MKVKFPDKEKIAELFSDDEKSELSEGIDIVDLLDMAVQALKIAIEEFPLEDYKPIEEYLGYDPYYQIDPAILQKLNIPSVMLTSDEDGLPLLYLRIFTKDGRWLGEAKCNLVSAAGFFAGNTLALVSELKKAGMNVSDEDLRVFVVRKTANTLKSAFDKLKDRVEITIASFLDEVWVNWAELWYEYHARDNSLQGFKMKRFAFAKQKEQLLEKHGDNIRALWADDSSEQLSGLKKQLLALYYKKTYEHWKEMERMQAEGKNWRRYVRAGDMSDVTDDLIEEFERGANISGLALEHAARRAELYNIFDVREKRLEKRKVGIMDSGYSRSRLFELKSEGEELLKKREMNQSTAE